MEAIWSSGKQSMKEAGASRRPHVATLGQPIQQSISSDVATRDVSTSRRGNVATSARDLPSIIKSNKGSEFGGIGRRTN